MQRQIRFRAWDNEEKRYWWNVQNAYDTLDHHCCPTDKCLNTDWMVNLPDSSFGNVLENENYTIEQYTGLKDSKDCEIYEGDIVLRYEKYDTGRTREMEVYWNQKSCGWSLRALDVSMHISDLCILEVIGNIHETKLQGVK